MWFRNIAGEYPLEYAALCFAIGTLPQWIASVWSLFSSEPLASKLAGGINMKLPELSGYWVTVPLGLVMFGYLLYVLRSQNPTQSPSAQDLFFLSMERFISDPIARTKILSVLLIVTVVWLVVLQQRVKSLEVEMFRYVLPREMTTEQKEEFGKYLLSNSHPQEVRIRYVMGDSEALRYAEDIASAFREGNWAPSIMAINSISISCHDSVRSVFPIACNTELEKVWMENGSSLEGVHVQQTDLNPPRSSTVEEKRKPSPMVGDIVRQAFRSARILTGSGYSYTTDPVNTITVFIGSRPRHRHGIPPAKFFTGGMSEEAYIKMTNDDF